MSLRTGKASTRALESLKTQGLSPADKPGFDLPSLPRDLTQISDEDLMVLYSEFTAYADFIGVQVSCAQVDERSLEKELTSMENVKMLSSEGKSENRVTFARAQVAVDPEIVSIKQQVDEAHAYRKLIESLASNLERDSNLVSRELTRRTASVARRSSRWSA